MSAPIPNDLPAALLNSALRLRKETRRLRWLAAQLGDHRDLPPEVAEALSVLVRWAARVAANSSSTGPVSVQPAPVEQVEIPARPRLRQPMRRTRR